MIYMLKQILHCATIPAAFVGSNKVKCFKIMSFNRVISLLYTFTIGFALNSYPFYFRKMIEYIRQYIIHIVFLCHFPIDIRVIVARFIYTIKTHIARAYIKLFLTTFTTHSKSSRTTINFFSCNPAIFIFKNPGHVLNSFLVCF